MQKLSFFNLFFFNKKGTVSIISFTLILLVLLLLLSFVFIYVESSKEDLKVSKKSLELVNSFSVFRDTLIRSIDYNNSFVYKNSLDSLDIEYHTKSGSPIVNVTGETDSVAIWLNMSTLGVKFCGNYNFSPVNSHNFTFNGSCLRLD